MVLAACSISGDATDKETAASAHDVALFKLSDPNVHQKAAPKDRMLWNERGWTSSKVLGNVTGGKGFRQRHWGGALDDVTGGNIELEVTLRSILLFLTPLEKRLHIHFKE